ncbi:hypothetical protein ABPG72_011367 [Tetrahymena utriculariae]
MDQIANKIDKNQLLEANLKCPKHLNKKIEWIRLVEDSDPCVLKCSKCLEKTEFVNYVYIDDLLESTNQTIIEGWNFQDEPEIQKKLQQISSRESEVDDIKDKIRNIFKNLRMKIDSKIEEKQEEIFQFIDQQKNLQKEFNQIFQKEKLIQVVKNINLEFEQQNLMLKEIIKANNLNKDTNKQAFLNYINNFNEIINFDLSIYNQIENSLCEAIDNENWWLQKDVPQYEFTNRNNIFQVKCIDSLSKCVNKNDLDIDFSQNLINTNEAANIGSAIQRCPNIIHFSLNLCKSQINAEGFQSIICCLKRCQNIRYLNFNLSELSVNLFHTVNNGLNRQSSFNYNNYCQFWLSISNSIAGLLSKLQSITELELDLSQNEVGPEGFKIIISALQSCSNITKLNFNLSNLFLQFQTDQFTQRQVTFGREEAKQFQNTLKKLTKITQLSLNFSLNMLGGEETQAIFSALETFKTFKSLNLNYSYNLIDDISINILADSLLKCKHIENLDLNLSFNLCSQNDADAILYSLLSCQNIENTNINIEQDKVGFENQQNF